MNDTEEAGTSEAFLDFDDFSFDDFAGLNEWNEDDKVFASCDAFTTECDVGNGEGQMFANSGTHAETLDKRGRR